MFGNVKESLQPILKLFPQLSALFQMDRVVMGTEQYFTGLRRENELEMFFSLAV
jgi:hypothetical protein